MAPSQPPRKSPRGGGIVLSFLFAMAMAGAAVYWIILRDDSGASSAGAPAGAATAAAAPSSATAAPLGELPDLHFERPAYASAEFVENTVVVHKVDGRVETRDDELRLAVDYGRGVAHVDATTNGKNPQAAVLTADHNYYPGQVFGEPWTRRPRGAGGDTTMDARDHLPLYQDLITPAVREHARHLQVTTEMLDDVAVSTYRFEIDFRHLPAGATAELPPNADPNLFLGTMRVSADGDGMVRLFELHLDGKLIRDAVSAGDEGSTMTLSLRTEILSLSPQPLDIQPPSNYVDAPAG